MTTTASDRGLRTENRDVNRRLEAIETDLQNLKDFRVETESEFRRVNGKLDSLDQSINADLDEMQETNESILDAIASLRAYISNWMSDDKKSQANERRGFDPVEIEAESSEWNSRYHNFSFDRRIGADRLDRAEYAGFDGFGMSMKSDKKPLNRFNKLQQTGSVEDDMQEFEKVRFQYKCSESEALDLFLGGLKEKLQCLVRLNKPTTVAEACDYATVYEEALKPIPSPSPFLRKILDAECSRVEPEELGVKEVNEKCKEYQEREAKRKNEEEELNVVLQTVEDSMELQTETRKDAEQVYNVQNVDLQADVEEELSSLEAAQMESEDTNTSPPNLEVSVVEFSELCKENEQLKPTVREIVTMADFEVANCRGNDSSMKGEKVIGLDGMVVEALWLNLVVIVKAMMEVCSPILCSRRLLAMEYVNMRCQEVQPDFKRYRKRTMLAIGGLLLILEGKDKFERQGNSRPCLESFGRATWDFKCQILQLDCKEKEELEVVLMKLHGMTASLTWSFGKREKAWSWESYLLVIEDKDSFMEPKGKGLNMKIQTPGCGTDTDWTYGIEFLNECSAKMLSSDNCYGVEFEEGWSFWCKCISFNAVDGNYGVSSLCWNFKKRKKKLICEFALGTRKNRWGWFSHQA